LESSFLHFSSADVAKGVAYASNDHVVGRGKDKRAVLGASLDSDMLRTLANAVGVHWYTKHRRRPKSFYTAKRETLLRLLPQSCRNDSVRFDAYSSAVSKLFSNRAHYARHRRASEPSVVTPRTIPDPSLFGEGKDGQRVMLF
jgi:hypothetical protein